MNRVAVMLYLLVLVGCSASGAVQGLNVAAQTEPSVLNNVEQLKVQLVLAPIAGCVSLLQGVNTQLNAMRSGSPGLPLVSAR